jgi:NAD(P)-dependent dehydrogenase (short-subunit alcohol dehydrogenase family)
MNGDGFSEKEVSMKGMLEGKVALITGAGSGIGRASGVLFAREGAKLILSDVNVKGGQETLEMVKKEGGEGIFVRTDVTQRDEVNAMVKKGVETFGRLDCAFNCAGIAGNLEPFLETTENDWERVISTNLKGHWHLMKAEIPEMLKVGKGAIVNIASICGKVGLVNNTFYCAARFGDIGMTKTVALELAEKGIRVNAVAPGGVDTPLFHSFTQGDKAVQDHIRGLHPMKRLARPEEVAEAACWLLSDRSSFTTGHVLMVDGGVTAA